MQIRDNFVPPILFTLALNCFNPVLRRHLSHTAFVWRFVVCQVLPDFARTAATRFSRRVAGRTHLPCSRLHARLAGDIAATRW